MEEHFHLARLGESCLRLDRRAVFGDMQGFVVESDVFARIGSICASNDDVRFDFLSSDLIGTDGSNVRDADDPLLIQSFIKYIRMHSLQDDKEGIRRDILPVAAARRRVRLCPRLTVARMSDLLDNFHRYCM